MTVKNGKLEFTRGSPVWVEKTLSGSNSPFSLSFDYYFSEIEGFFDVFINDIWVDTVRASDDFINEWRTETIFLGDEAFLGDSFKLTIYTDGPHGSQMFVDNLRLGILSVPEPATAALLLVSLGLFGLTHRRRLTAVKH